MSGTSSTVKPADEESIAAVLRAVRAHAEHVLLPALEFDGTRVLGRALRTLVADVGGVRVEEKGCAVALHTRGATADAERRAQAVLSRLTGDLVAGGALQVLSGDGVVDVVPGASWTVADALCITAAEVRGRRCRGVWPMYVGTRAPGTIGRLPDHGALAVPVAPRGRGGAVSLSGPAGVQRLLVRLAEEFTDAAVATGDPPRTEH
jgi:hypothetical protein